MICGTLLGITFGYREHQVVYYRLTALKSIAWEMYQPYSHKDQEGLQEPLNRHGGPAPADGGVLKEKGEENCSWKIFISVTVPLHFFSGSAGDGWARASCRLGSHSYTNSTFSFCLSVR